MSQITEYVKRATSSAPDQIDRLWTAARMRIPVALPEDPTELLTEGARRAVAFLAPRAGSVVVDFFSTIGSLLAMLFALFFLLRDGQAMARRLRDQLPFSREDGDRLLHDTRDLVIASIGAGVVVAATQGLVGGVAFWVMGLAAPVLWGVVMAICSLIPAVGAALVWMPAAIGLLVSGQVARGVTLLIVGALDHQHGGQRAAPDHLERPHGGQRARGVLRPAGRRDRVRVRRHRDRPDRSRDDGHAPRDAAASSGGRTPNQLELRGWQT